MNAFQKLSVYNKPTLESNEDTDLKIYVLAPTKHIT